MSTDQLTFTGTLHVNTCWCGIRHAIPAELNRHVNEGGKAFCPLGHSYVRAGKTDAQKLEEAQAQLVHVKDQLGAAKADAEATRVQLLRDRQRWANGMCPCCRRNFSGLAEHVRKEHPDYDIKVIKKPVYKCSCWQEFETFHGLRVHQGRVRPDNWATQSPYWAHLTVTD